MIKNLKNQNSIKLSFKVPLFLFFLSSIIFLFYLSTALHQPVGEILWNFQESLYSPNANFFLANNSNGINILRIFYIFFIFASLLLLVFHKGRTLFFEELFSPSLSQMIKYLAIFTLITFTLFQQQGRLIFFMKQKTVLQNKSTHEKYSLIFGDIYSFSKKSQTLLDKNHSGLFLSDYDLTKNLQMFTERVISYFVYPKISVNFTRPNLPECIIGYFEDPANIDLPAGYKIILSQKNKRLFLAVKKEPSYDSSF